LFREIYLKGGFLENMPKPPFEEIWRRILRHEGETFYTKTRLPFTYRIEGNVLIPDRTGYPLHRSNFEKAYALVPMDGPGEINQIVRGPAYVWAILHDPRISKGRLVNILQGENIQE